MNDIAEVEKREESLRTAMLSGDVGALSSLIDDRLVFTGPDGTVLNKTQDLSAHESGILKFSKLDIADSSVHQIGDMVLVTTKATLAGTFGERSIDGMFAYTRLWSRSSGQWRVVAGHASRVG